MSRTSTIMPQDEVALWLVVTWPALEFEADRNWIWVTSDLAPLHRKCECVQCSIRKTIRQSIHSIGFVYASNDHPCPSGKPSRWAHHCEHPIRFKRKAKAARDDTTDTEIESDTSVADAQLLAALVGLT